MVQGVELEQIVVYKSMALMVRNLCMHSFAIKNLLVWAVERLQGMLQVWWRSREGKEAR